MKQLQESPLILYNLYSFILIYSISKIHSEFPELPIYVFQMTSNGPCFVLPVDLWSFAHYLLLIFENIKQETLKMLKNTHNTNMHTYKYLHWHLLVDKHDS